MECVSVGCESVFLYGEMKEEIYVDQLEGFIKHEEEENEYRLNKALYGLKQVPTTWYSIINNYFQREGFTKS